MVYVLYSRLGKTMQKGTKLVCRKTLTRHLINRQEGTFSQPIFPRLSQWWRHKLDPYAYHGLIRKDTGHLSGFLSRAMVNSWKVKILSSLFSLGCSPFQKPLKLFFYVWDTFCIWIWWKINDKRGVVLQAYKKRMKVLILKLMGSTVPILFIFFHIL